VYQFEITFKEFVEKFRETLLLDNSDMVLNVRVIPKIGFEFFIPHKEVMYHLMVNEDDLKQFYNSEHFSRDAMFRMFQEELLDKSNTVYIR